MPSGWSTSKRTAVECKHSFKKKHSIILGDYPKTIKWCSSLINVCEV